MKEDINMAKFNEQLLQDTHIIMKDIKKHDFYNVNIDVNQFLDDERETDEHDAVKLPDKLISALDDAIDDNDGVQHPKFTAKKNYETGMEKDDLPELEKNFPLDYYKKNY